ncbi:MAG: cytochrome c [Anaerolineales bacterium]
MRSEENYTPFVVSGLGLTLAILVTFQAYIFREPARIRVDEAADKLAAISAGEVLYADNCANCHGADGEGDRGPALNSHELLAQTTDEALFSLARTGVPGTIMPAWGQDFGGPFTDEQIGHIVAFVRAWEPNAPRTVTAAAAPDPTRGAAIYASTCAICHGENGQGGESAPALNDPVRLAELSDAWYRSTISHGRPAKGMPTWGTVLSPAQISDLVALLGAWREGKTVSPDITLIRYLSNALYALRQFDRPDAEFYLRAALTQADSAQAELIQDTIVMIQENQLFVAESSLITLLPPEQMGQELFETNCAACHGSNGEGDLGPDLHANAFIQSKTDEELVAFVLQGRRGTGMDGFEGILLEDEVNNILILLRAWQD